MRALTPNQVFVRRMKLERLRRGWSVQQLADKVREVGGDISRGTIAKIETDTRGSRGVTLDEAVVIAVALRVPLTLLFLPIDTAENVALAPKVEVHPWLAWEWLRGEEPLTQNGIPTWMEGIRPSWAYDTVRSAQKAYQAADIVLRRARDAGDSDVPELRDRYDETVEALRDALAGMQDGYGLPIKGLVPPGLIRQLGLGRRAEKEV
jgi:transcriptional regulator with XRE-family HTH domain